MAEPYRVLGRDSDCRRLAAAAIDTRMSGERKRLTIGKEKALSVFAML